MNMTYPEQTVEAVAPRYGIGSELVARKSRQTSVVVYPHLQANPTSGRNSVSFGEDYLAPAQPYEPGSAECYELVTLEGERIHLTWEHLYYGYSVGNIASHQRIVDLRTGCQFPACLLGNYDGSGTWDQTSILDGATQMISEPPVEEVMEEERYSPEGYDQSVSAYAMGETEEVLVSEDVPEEIQKTETQLLPTAW